mgnify:CR=1 FL=1
MPNWILRIAASWGYPRIISATAQYLRQQKAVLAAILKYRSGGTLKDICRAYVAVTPNLTDDQIVDAFDKLVRDLAIVPFNQIVQENKIFLLAGNTKIPDFDSDPDNDVAVSDELGILGDKVLE